VKWTVLWGSGAENDLAQIWVNASHRQSVTDAANEVDRLLAIDPLDTGESREEGRRILLVPPLGVTFNVLPDDRIVRVLDVWRLDSRL